MEAIANFRGSAIMGDAGTTVGIPRFPRGEGGTSDRAKRAWFSAQARDRFQADKPPTLKEALNQARKTIAEGRQRVHEAMGPARKQIDRAQDDLSS